MNRKHWNTVRIDEHIPDKLVYEQMDDSYRLVMSSLSSVGLGRLAAERLGSKALHSTRERYQRESKPSSGSVVP